MIPTNLTTFKTIPSTVCMHTETTNIAWNFTTPTVQNPISPTIHNSQHMYRYVHDLHQMYRLAKCKNEQHHRRSFFIQISTKKYAHEEVYFVFLANSTLVHSCPQTKTMCKTILHSSPPIQTKIPQISQFHHIPSHFHITIVYIAHLSTSHHMHILSPQT